MQPDQIVGVLASLALLAFLAPGVLNLGERERRVLRVAAGVCLGAALAVAIALSIAWFAR